MPLISVILPVYNGMPYLKDAVDSILLQTYKDFELICIDDGSTDDSLLVLQAFAANDSRVKVIANKYEQGIVGALNSGIDLSIGKYIARMDSDDISLPNRFSRQISYLEANPEIGICGTWVRTFGRVDGVVWRLPEHHEDICVRLLFNTPLAHPSIMCKREVFDSYKIRYDQEFCFAEDFNLYSQYSSKVCFANIPEVLLLYRTHLNNIGTLRAQHQELLCRKIQLRELEKIGIIATQDELELHRNISTCNYIKSESFLTKCSDWFEKIKDANEIVQVLNENALAKYIQQQEQEIKSFIYQKDTVFFKRVIHKIKHRIPLALKPILSACYSKVLMILMQLQDKVRKYTSLISFNRVRLKKNLPFKFKIGIAILAYERPEYLEICLNSLFETKLYDYDVTFLIQDDGSQDPRVREIIERPRSEQYKIIRYFSTKGPNNAGAAINKALKKLNELDDFDIVGWSDPDALYHPEWLNKTLKICLWAKENHREHSLGPFSSFNSSDAAFHKVLGTYESPFGRFVVKRQMGMLNYFYFKSDLLKLGFFDENHDDESLMTTRLENLGVRNFCTDDSYVEHIGQLSVLNQWRSVPVSRAVYGLNLASGEWPSSLKGVGTLGYYKDVKGSQTIGVDVSSDVPIDLVIVAIEKDLVTLPFVVQGARKNLRHPLGNTFIVSPESPMIRLFCEQHKCVYVNEDTLLPFKKNRINYKSPFGANRSGWLYQQLLKLAADSLCDNQHYLIIDADTVCIQPQVFELNTRLLLLHSDEFHRPYFNVCERLLGYPAQNLLSCVAHQMLFNKNRLQAMKNHIENRSGLPWYEAILAAVDYSEESGFSEFELYGQWCMSQYPSDTVREYWFNSAAKRSKGLSYESIEKEFRKKYRSISYHDYISVSKLRRVITSLSKVGRLTY